MFFYTVEKPPRLSEFDLEIPENLIAKYPLPSFKYRSETLVDVDSFPPHPDKKSRPLQSCSVTPSSSV